MKKTILIAAILLATPASAQVVKPQIFSPPCNGGHCLNATSGARVVKKRSQVSAQKLACPAGTYYDARKGSCHVAGPSYGAVTHY